MNDYQRSRMKIGPYFGLKTTFFEVEKGGLRDYGIVRNSAMITIRNKTADVEKIKPRNTPNTQKDLVMQKESYALVRFGVAPRQLIQSVRE